MTYAALDARANQLAHHLIASGVRPEDPVAVCLPRTTDLVVAALAVLKAGGVHLPVDPALPRERVAWMLAESRVRTVVTTDSLAGLLTTPGTPGNEAPAVVRVDLVRERTATLPRTAPRSRSPAPMPRTSSTPPGPPAAPRPCSGCTPGC
ncbi:AMP-binding protein [Streptomyces sp. AD16]|nr:AMP-binding protein [Streptomyces sp. AD16]